MAYVTGLINSIFVSEFFMTTFWRWIINVVFNGIPNYGLRIVVFTVTLKLLLSPMDFFNRKKGKDNARILKKLKPELDKITERYADNQSELFMRKRALQKQAGYGMGMTCLSSIVTLFLFITLWTSFTSISREKSVEITQNLESVYSAVYEDYADKYTEVSAYNIIYKEDYISVYVKKNKGDENELRSQAISILEIDGFDENIIYTAENTAPAPQGESENTVQKQFNNIRRFIAQQAVLIEYEENQKQSFLWIKNIFRPDTHNNPIPNSSDYSQFIGAKSFDSQEYEKVMLSVTNKYYGNWNGFFILVALTVILNFINQRIALKQQSESQEQQAAGMAGTMKMMMYIMPIMFGFFAFTYASAFTLYMVTNAAMTFIITFTSNTVLGQREKAIERRIEEANRVKNAKKSSGSSKKNYKK